MITVMKFGGTSVGSAEAIKRVANIIMNTDGEKIAVVSAMSGTTNYLVSVADHPLEDVDTIAEQFAAKHIATAKEVLDEEHYAMFEEEFNVRLEAFKKAVSADRSDAYYKDAVVSQGERFSSLILACYLEQCGCRSVAICSEDAGIAAVGSPQAGSADLIRSASGMSLKVRPILATGTVPVITGFYGAMEDGRPLTFGRGGSDYSAAVVANAIDADMLEIWTDVDGFMSADPRIVKDAVKINEMKYAEAAELAYFGAKVLHPRTIEPVRLKHIPLKVRNSFKPEEPGTLIHHVRMPRDSLLKCVAAKTDLSIITINSAEIAYRPAIVARIMALVAEIDVVLYTVSTSLSTLAFVVHNDDITRTLRQLNRLDGGEIERIDVKTNVALVCAVGDDLLSKIGLAGDVFMAVKEAGANVEMISEGASDVSLNFIVPANKALEVIKTLHAKYIAGGGA